MLSIYFKQIGFSQNSILETEVYLESIFYLNLNEREQ